MTSQHGYIAAAFQEEDDHQHQQHVFGRQATGGCAWRIRGAPGQVINITLWDFNSHHHPQQQQQQLMPDLPLVSAPVASPPCTQLYAVITDGPLSASFADVSTTRVCGGGQRIRHVMTSLTHVVDITLEPGVKDTDSALQQRLASYILEYEGT